MFSQAQIIKAINVIAQEKVIDARKFQRSVSLSALTFCEMDITFAFCTNSLQLNWWKS